MQKEQLDDGSWYSWRASSKEANHSAFLTLVLSELAIWFESIALLVLVQTT